MINFESDYVEGMHPEILQRMVDTNLQQESGYGADHFTMQAKKKIAQACQCKNAQVFLLTGGTQTNAVVIASMLHDWEGVIGAATAHIGTHEAGAIEYTGHKVLTLPEHYGKIDPQELIDYLAAFDADENHEHEVFPGMVYLTHPTEYGTLYTKQELQRISEICKERNIPIYLDGARMAYALAGEGTDVTLADIAEYCDAFYIGGTKCGSIAGEAVVFTKNNMPQHFLTSVKKRGALLEKGRLLGIAFDEFFKNGNQDDLYYRVGRHAIECACELKKILKEKGYPFFLETPTNQQFIIMKNEQIAKLRNSVGISFWQAYGEDASVVRFATSWATTNESLQKLRDLL